MYFKIIYYTNTKNSPFAIQEGGSEALLLLKSNAVLLTTINNSHSQVRNHGCKGHWIMDLYFSNSNKIFEAVGHMSPEKDV